MAKACHPPSQRLKGKEQCWVDIPLNNRYKSNVLLNYASVRLSNKKYKVFVQKSLLVSLGHHDTAARASIAGTRGATGLGACVPLGQGDGFGRLVDLRHDALGGARGGGRAIWLSKGCRRSCLEVCCLLDIRWGKRYRPDVRPVAP